MRRLAALGIAVLVGVLAAPTPAVAGPAAALCTPSNARGGVPADFALDACATARTVTVFNQLSFPVVVRPTGSLGTVRRLQERKGPGASVLRQLGLPGVLLLPGDVLRWPLGPGGAKLDASAMQPAAAAAIVDDIAQYLPRPGEAGAGPADYAAFAGVVTDIADAVQGRASCAEGANFIRAEACDVTAASAIGRAVVQLPQRTAYNMLSVVLQPENWTAWATTSAVLTGSTRLVQAARAVPTAATAPAQPRPHPPAAAPRPGATPRPQTAPRPPAAPHARPAAPTWRDVLAALAARAQASEAHSSEKSDSEPAKGKPGRKTKKKHGD